MNGTSYKYGHWGHNKVLGEGVFNGEAFRLVGIVDAFFFFKQKTAYEIGQ